MSSKASWAGLGVWGELGRADVREEMGARCVWMKLGRLQNVQNLNVALVCDSTAHHGNGAAGIPGVPTASVDPTQHR